MTNEFKPVNLEEVRSIESYVFNLVTLSISLQSLFNLQVTGAKQGLFDDAELELANVVAWESKRTLGYIQQLLDLIQEKYPFDTNHILDKLKASS